MPVIRVPPDYKPSTLDTKTKLKLVTEALLNAQTKAFAGTLILERTPENKLDQLDPREIISALNAIEKANEGLFVVLSDLSRWLEKDVKPTPTLERLKEHFGPNWQTIVDEDAIVLKLQDRFDNWCEAQRYKQSLTLANLSIESREKVLATVTAIYAQFELSSNPKVTITWSPPNSTEDYEARKLSLEFLQNKEVVTGFKFHFSGNGVIEVNIDIKEFFRLRDELLGLYAPDSSDDLAEQAALALSDPPGVVESLKWENITIQFVNGHEARIWRGSTGVTLGFKDLGFEDGRTRQPNYQWALLRLFAAKKGEISWENSEAADKLKKRKQALSETLKTYFKIDDDPFYPYKDEKTYRTKFKLKAEGD